MPYYEVKPSAFTLCLTREGLSNPLKHSSKATWSTPCGPEACVIWNKGALPNTSSIFLSHSLHLTDLQVRYRAVPWVKVREPQSKRRGNSHAISLSQNASERLCWQRKGWRAPVCRSVCHYLVWGSYHHPQLETSRRKHVSIIKIHSFSFARLHILDF